MQAQVFSDAFVLGVPSGGSRQGPDRWMLPVHCQGLLYTPRLLAVMLLLARHRRLVESIKVEGPAEGSCAMDAEYDGTHVAGAVCEGRTQRSGAGAPAAIDCATRKQDSSVILKVLHHGFKGATAPQQPDVASNGCVKDVSSGSAQLSVSSAYSRARQRVRRELLGLKQASCVLAPGPVETLSRLLQQHSPDIAASQHMHRASTATLASLPLHDGLVPCIHQNMGPGGVQNVDSGSEGHVKHGSSLQVSLLNARGVSHAENELQGAYRDTCGAFLSVTGSGNIFSSSVKQHSPEGPSTPAHVRFGGLETFSNDADSQIRDEESHKMQEESWWQVMMNLGSGRKTARAEMAAHSGTPFTRAWEQVRSASTRSTTS